MADRYEAKIERYVALDRQPIGWPRRTMPPLSGRCPRISVGGSSAGAKPDTL